MSTSLRRLHIPFRKLWPPQAGAHLFPAYHTFGSSRAEWGKDEQNLRVHADPEYRKKRYESRSVADKKRYYENHEYHELKKKASRDYRRCHAQDPIYKIRKYISKWITKFAWVREELDWKSHVPIYSDTRVVRYCKSCEHAGIRGTKLWWSRKYDPTIYDCNRCFLGADPRKALPKHCEDVTTLKELRQRRDELRAMKFSTKNNSDKAANTTEPKSGGL